MSVEEELQQAKVELQLAQAELSALRKAKQAADEKFARLQFDRLVAHFDSSLHIAASNIQHHHLVS